MNEFRPAPFVARTECHNTCLISDEKNHSASGSWTDQNLLVGPISGTWVNGKIIM